MSYGWAAGLQAAIFQRLSGDADVVRLVGGRVHDAPLELDSDTAFDEHVSLGEETVRPWGTKTSVGALHDFEVTVHSSRDGFDMAKRIADAICAALVDAPLIVPNGRVVALRFLRAKADRGRAPEKRKVVLRFRAVLDEDT